MSESMVNVLNIVGDDPLVEGGGVVYTDPDKKGTWFSWWGQPDAPDIDPDTHYGVYTVAVPDDVLETYSHIDVDEFAAFTEDEPEELQRYASSDSLEDRVMILDALQSFIGSSSMDQNPVVMTFAAMVHRWGTEIAEPQSEEWEEEYDWEEDEEDEEEMEEEDSGTPDWGRQHWSPEDDDD